MREKEREVGLQNRLRKFDHCSVRCNKDLTPRNCPHLQYPSLFTVEGEWVSITQTIKVDKLPYKTILENSFIIPI